MFLSSYGRRQEKTSPRGIQGDLPESLLPHPPVAGGSRSGSLQEWQYPGVAASRSGSLQEWQPPGEAASLVAPRPCVRHF